jgi:MFS transporter, YNFM family, putative membrane transport protein
VLVTVTKSGSVGRPGFTTRVAIFLLGMCALLNLYSTQPVLAQIARWASVSQADAAWTVSATTLGVAVMAPVAGAVSDRLGRKRIVLLAIAVMLVATALCMVSTTFGELLAFRFLQGLATPYVFAVVLAYIGDEFVPAVATRLNSLYVAGTAFGGFAGRFFPGLAVNVSHDWRDSFWPLLVILSITFLAASAWLPMERAFVASPSLTASFTGIGVIIKDWRLLCTCVVGACLLFQQVASFTFASLHLQQPPLNLTTLQVSLVFVVFLAPTVVTPWVGRSIDRIGRVPTFLAAAVLGAGGLALALVPSTWSIIIGLACSCVSVFAGQACATGFTAHRASRFRSAAVGLYLTAYYLGGTVGAVAPASAYANNGWPAVVLVIMLVIAAGVIAATLAWRSTRAHADSV